MVSEMSGVMEFNNNLKHFLKLNVGKISFESSLRGS